MISVYLLLDYRANGWGRGAHLARNLPPIFVNLYNKPGILYMQ